MTAAADYILHHYDTSPFSEKVRLTFGVKDLAWRSVLTPNMMPKPDLVPLTGGYRRAPVMQIGADVFCDSQVILAEIERRSPGSGQLAGLDSMVNLWADRLFFQASVAVIFAELGDNVGADFIKDREKLSGGSFNIAAMKAAAIPMRGQWRGHAAWIEHALAARGDFLAGEAPGLIDIAAHMNVWFVSQFTSHLAGPLLAGLDRVVAWRDRLNAVGHGTRAEMSGADALTVAKSAQPGDFTAHDGADPSGLVPGAKVTVAADDYGRDPIPGTLVAATPDRVVIARDTPDLGALHLHFPRAGYILAAAG